MPIRNIYGSTTVEVANSIKRALIDIGVSNAVSGDKYASIRLPSGLYKQYLTIEVTGVYSDNIEIYVGTSDNHVDGSTPAGYSRFSSSIYAKIHRGAVLIGRGLDGIILCGFSSGSAYGTLTLGNVYDESDNIIGFLVRLDSAVGWYSRLITNSGMPESGLTGFPATLTSSGKLMLSNLYVTGGGYIGKLKNILATDDSNYLLRPCIQIDSDIYVNAGGRFVRV